MAHLSLLTLGVRDLARSARFYADLGWQRSSASAGDIVFLRGTPVLALYGWDALAADARLPAEPCAGFGGITLAMNLPTEQAVDALLERAVAAGGRLLKPAQRVEWGGYSGYFADPDGHPWEVAHNPFFGLEPDGRIVLPD